MLPIGMLNCSAIVLYGRSSSPIKHTKEALTTRRQPFGGHSYRTCLLLPEQGGIERISLVVRHEVHRVGRRDRSVTAWRSASSRAARWSPAMHRFVPVAQCGPGSPRGAAMSFDRLPQHRRRSACTVSRLPRPGRQSVRSESPRLHSHRRGPAQRPERAQYRRPRVSLWSSSYIDAPPLCVRHHNPPDPSPGIPSPVASCQPVGCHSPLNRMSHASSRTSRDLSSPLLGNEATFLGHRPVHGCAGSDEGPLPAVLERQRGAAQHRRTPTMGLTPARFDGADANGGSGGTLREPRVMPLAASVLVGRCSRRARSPSELSPGE